MRNEQLGRTSLKLDEADPGPPQLWTLRGRVPYLEDGVAHGQLP